MSNDWFYALLEEERKAFEKGNYTTPSRLKKAFKPWSELIQEDDASLGMRSSGRRSIRRRARDLLRDVLTILGPEVLLLCTLVTSISKIATVEPKGLITDLRRWWDTASHPDSLTISANMLREEHSIIAQIASSQELASAITSISGGTSHSWYQALEEHLTEPEAGNTPPVQSTGTRPATTQHPAGETCLHRGAVISDIQSIKDSNEANASDTQDYPSGPVLHLKLSDLLSFLLQFETDADLQMKCPYFGVPLPSIAINLESTLGLSGKLEFSFRLSESLLQYMLASGVRTAAEVSD